MRVAAAHEAGAGGFENKHSTDVEKADFSISPG